MRIPITIVACVGIAACSSDADDSISSDTALRDRAPDAPFARFARPRVWVGALERPIELPLTPGSVRSPAAFDVDGDSIVSIDDTGKLVAHRNGRATVIARATLSRLDVEVQIGALRIDPARVVLQPGGTATLAVYVADERLAPEAASYLTADPEIAQVEAGVVHASTHIGETQIAADYGEARVEATIVVAPPRPGTVAVSASARRVRVGGLIALRLEAPAGAAVDWSTDRAPVLESVGGGVFLGRHVGRARACARALDQRSCASLEVIP